MESFELSELEYNKLMEARKEAARLQELLNIYIKKGDDMIELAFERRNLPGKELRDIKGNKVYFTSIQKDIDIKATLKTK